MNTAKKIVYAAGMLKKYGIRGLIRKVKETKADTVDQNYRSEWKQYMVSEEEKRQQREASFLYMPLISVVVPAYETPEPFLTALVDSVKNQTYRNWELCIADGSSSDRVRECLDVCAGNNPRIRYQKLAQNGGISDNTNAALAMARGAYIGLLDHDDMLAENALFEVVKAVNEHPEYEILYSDEDKIDETGTWHMRPHFKKDYDRELLLHYNYFCHFLVIKRTLFEEAGRLRSEYNGSQDYDLVLRMVDAAEASMTSGQGGACGRICHIPKILYHWRIHEGSTAGSFLSKDYAYAAGKRALEDHFKRIGRPAEVRTVRGGGYYEVAYPQSEQHAPTVFLSDHPDRESLNAAVMKLETECILLIGQRRFAKPSKKEVRRLTALCRQRNVGMVGVRYAQKDKLLFPKEFAGLPTDWKGYFFRAAVPQNVDWLPLDVCVIRRTAFLAAGGLEPEKEWRKQAPYFCSRVRQMGYEIVIDSEITIRI